MHIYESHLGGIYTTDEPQDWDDLYCEQCGDSDWEIGYVDDGDPESAWQMIMPNELECIGCLLIADSEDSEDHKCSECKVIFVKISEIGNF